MKDKLEELLEEIDTRMNYYIRRLDMAEYKDMQSSFVGHYLELKDIKELIEDIVYGEDREVHR